MSFPSLKGYEAASGQPPLVPPGTYQLAITDVKFLENAEGWEGVNFELTIQGGPQNERRVWHTFTLAYPKDRDIADNGRSQLKGFLTAASHPNPDEPASAVIKGLTLTGKVINRKNKKSGDMEARLADWTRLAKPKGMRPVPMQQPPKPAATPVEDDLSDEIPF